MSNGGKIRCSFPTAKEQQIAKSLNISPAIVNTLASAWMTRNPEKGDPSEEDIKNIWNSREYLDYYLAIPAYETIPFDSSRPLATSSKNGGIKLQRVFENNDLEYFFDYIQGNIESPTSKQKQEVFSRLKKHGYDINTIRDIIRTPKEAYQFLLWHEMSHIQNGDHTDYYTYERSNYSDYDKMSPSDKETVKDYMTEDKIEKELRASIEALQKAAKYEEEHPQLNTVDYRSLLINNTRGYFEGGGTTLYDLFPNFPRDMWEKMANYIFGEGALTQKDAKDILEYITNEIPYFISGSPEVINPTHSPTKIINSESAVIGGKSVQNEVDSTLVGSGYSMYSGDATGADSYWSAIGKQYGMNVTQYKASDINPENRQEATEKVTNAAKELGRVFPMKPNKTRDEKATEYSNNLLLRDWLQIKNSDTVFAIGELNSRNQVEGGTGWAVQMAISEGKQVYLFEQNRNTWMRSTSNGGWQNMSETPKLIANSTCIGTRKLKDNGKQAIRNVFEATFEIKPSEVQENTISNTNVVRSFGNNSNDSLPLSQTPTMEGLDNIQQMLNSFEELKTQEEEFEYIDELPEVGIDNLNTATIIDRRTEAARTFNYTVRKNREAYLARQFSDVITRKQEELIEEENNKLAEAISNNDKQAIYDAKTKISEYSDVETGRQRVVDTIGVLNILQEIYREWQDNINMSDADIDDSFGEGAAQYHKTEYQKVLDYFDILMEDAALIIEKKEGIRISFTHRDYNDGSAVSKLLGGYTIDADKENSEEEDNNDDAEQRVNNSEGWGFKVRMIDPHSTISKVVKRILGNILKENEDGSIDTDDLGNSRYLDEGHAYATLLDGLANMIDSDDFSEIDEQTREIVSLPALENLAKKYPWVNQVIDAIYADNDLASKFYTAFRNELISYWAQKNDQVFRLNGATAVDDAMSSTLYNYETGTKLISTSIYNQNSTINENNISKVSDIISKAFNDLNDYEYLEDSEANEVLTSLVQIFKSIGINTNTSILEGVINSEDGIHTLIGLLHEANDILTEAKRLENKHLIETCKKSYETINTVLGIVSETGGIISFRNGDKTFYSYSAPNYMDSMIKSLKNDQKRDSYIAENFQTEWFYDSKKGKYRNHWIGLLASDPEVVSQLEVMDLNSIESDGYNREDDYYTNWNSTQIKSGFIRQYFMYGYNPQASTQYAWYNFPIFSDSPVAKFIKFVRYTKDYEKIITGLLADLVEQELWRIRHVQDRRNKGVTPINNYDTNGDKFHFLPELNDLVVDNNGTLFLDKIIELRQARDINGMRTLIEESVNDIMQQNFDKFLENMSDAEYSKITEVLKQDGVIGLNEDIPEKFKEYFWNSTFATSQIIQLTTTDLAFYKNQVDFQKRYKEVYGAGTRLNTNSKYGKKTERVIYLRDNIITSMGYSSIKDILDDAVKAGKLNSLDRDFILTKYNKVNVSDAQSYRTLESFRSILDMLGKWDDKMETTFKNITSGTWDISDFNTIWQTIKPFVFTNVIQDDGLGGKMRTPVQHKNSEFLMMAMYEMFGGPLSKSPKLKALNQFMHDKSIDVAHFESVVKVGGEGIIDINFSIEKVKSNMTEEIDSAAKEALKNKYSKASLSDRFKAGNDYLLITGKITQKEYNTRMSEVEPTEEEVYNMLNDACFSGGVENSHVIHSIPYKDYMIQQPTPEHLLDTTAIYGSQFRNLIISDISSDAVFKLHGKEYSKDALIGLYQSLITENLLEDFEALREEFNINNIEGLQKLLIKQVKDNPKYGRDMVEALQLVEIINPNTGIKEQVFNIPLWNPSTTERFQELVNSLFKNRITKQHIKGGNCILVSDFGLTDKLNIIYNKEGDKTSGVKGIECYMPAFSKKFFEPFLRTSKDGSYQYLDINSMPKELRKLVGYRIPTEGKYSMVPLIVKGFLPQQNGSTIMLPADITTIAGSDFDVDKLFIMIPEFKMEGTDWKRAREDFARENKIYNEVFSKFTNSELAQELINDEPPTFKEWFALQEKDKYKLDTPVPVKIRYNVNKSPQDNSREARNNMLIDISYSILTHPDTAYKFLSPGNFDTIKKWARASEIITRPTVLKVFMENYNVNNPSELESTLKQMSEKELSDFVNKYIKLPNPLTLDNFVYFHQQNMTGGTLIGMYANNTTFQSKLQHSKVGIKDEYTFNLNGRNINSLHDVTSKIGELISKNCSEFSAASVDNAKDPVLASLMQNKNTARITAFLLTAGVSIEEIALIFSVPTMRIAAQSTNVLRYLNSTKESILASLQESGVEVKINREHIIKEGFTSKQLLSYIMKTLYADSDPIKSMKEDLYLIEYFIHIVNLSSEFSEFARICRADSPNNAVAISIAGAKNQVQAVKTYRNLARKGKTYFTNTLDILQEEAVNINDSRDVLREKINRSPLPMLEAFYTLGISSATKLSASYFIQSSEYVNKLVDILYMNSPNGVLSDKTLNTFYKDLVLFALSDTDLFGDSKEGQYEQKRNYYLNSFPNKFMEILSENPDLKSIGILNKIYPKNGKLIMERSGRLSQSAKDTYMRDFDGLLYSDNPVAHRLAIDLFMYSYYAEGLNYGPNNYGYFFSTFFLNRMGTYVQSLRDMKYNMHDNSIYDKFIPMFYANHAIDRGLLPKISAEVNDDTVELLPSQVINPNTMTESFFPYIYVDAEGGGLYRIDPTSSTRDKIFYTKDVEFGTHFGRSVVYNARKSVSQIAEMLDKESTVRYGKKDTEESSNNNSAIPVDLSEIADMDISPEDLSESSIPMELLNYSDILGGLDIESIAEQYNEEDGEDTLDERLCIRKI